MSCSACWHLLASLGFCGCLWVSMGVCLCFVLSKYALKRLREVIRGCLSAVCGCLWSLDASEGISECWNFSEKHNFIHLTLLRHQNTKTRWYKVSKNHWVMALFEIFRSVWKILQYTVSLDHPVLRTFSTTGCFYSSRVPPPKSSKYKKVNLG